MHSALTADAGWWLEAVPFILAQLSGREGTDGSMPVPDDATPELIGEWVADRMQDELDRLAASPEEF